MEARLNGVGGIVKAAAKDFGEDECAVRAAALAYYTVFALPPLLILLIMVAGLIWDPQEVQRALETQFAGVMGESGARQIHEMIAQADRPGSGGVFATLGSIAGLVFGATGAFLQLQGALNRAWEVQPDPEQGGIKRFVMKRLFSLGMVLGIGFLLAVSLALTAGIAVVGDAVGTGIPAAVLHVLNFVLAFAVLTLLFAAMFKILPDAEIAWKDVWPGALGTGLLFVAGKFALGFYLGRSSPGDAFGAAGALAVVLVWTYYAGMILLFGAEFTQQWARQRGSGIRPEKGAVRVVEQAERGGSGERAPATAGRPAPAPSRRAGADRPAGRRAASGRATVERQAASAHGAPDRPRAERPEPRGGGLLRTLLYTRLLLFLARSIRAKRPDGG